MATYGRFVFIVGKFTNYQSYARGNKNRRKLKIIKNMTKNQKIWLFVFLAMFIIPEILWGLLNTFLFGAIYRGNGPSNFSVLPALQSNGLNALIVCIEFIGVLFTTIFCFLFYHPKNIILKILIIIFLVFLSLLTFYLLLFSYNFSHMQLG